MQSDIKEPVAVGETLTEIMDELQSSSRGFIEANTISGTLHELNNKHIIPVFVKENEPAISHGEFIDATMQAVSGIFKGETILRPNIRLSHPIKGRTPEARNKPASELLEHEKTLYYERMAFLIEIPSITNEIEGNRLNLTIGGVKSYNLDSLMTKNSEQHFKVFIGFKNLVCTNLCVSTDGYLGNLKVRSIGALYRAIESLVMEFDAVHTADELQRLQGFALTESQFAQLVGRARMYRHMPDGAKQSITELGLGDAQLNAVCKDYYTDKSFCCNSDGSINLWRLYNLLTGANKSSYIDMFLDRSAQAFNLTRELMGALQNKSDCWYIN
ncbi:MAG: DUF3871 family protein [Flavipsychrobacter sp.]|nr:DUF3871 family protein [Flavipsychrobacter sp.]